MHAGEDLPVFVWISLPADFVFPVCQAFLLSTLELGVQPVWLT